MSPRRGYLLVEEPLVDPEATPSAHRLIHNLVDGTDSASSGQEGLEYEHTFSRTRAYPERSKLVTSSVNGALTDPL